MSIWKTNRRKRLIEIPEKKHSDIKKPQLIKLLEPVWTTSPCIGCQCEKPELCKKLDDWILKTNHSDF